MVNYCHDFKPHNQSLLHPRTAPIRKIDTEKTRERKTVLNERNDGFLNLLIGFLYALIGGRKTFLQSHFHFLLNFQSLTLVVDSVLSHVTF